MTPAPRPEPAEPTLLPGAFGFRRHVAAFAGALILGLAVNWGFGARLPIFWPFAAWSVGLAIHFFFASAHDIKEDWVADRADELRQRSYDFDHIRNIQNRIADREDTLVHPTEREPRRKDDA